MCEIVRVVDVNSKRGQQLRRRLLRQGYEPIHPFDPRVVYAKKPICNVGGLYPGLCIRSLYEGK